MTSSTTRPPAVAGMFYPDDPRELKRTIERAFSDWKFGPGALPPVSGKRKIYGIISPHAGYPYSGAVAANAYYQISGQEFDNAVLIGPNHYGLGSGVATMRSGIWKTPFGEVQVNSKWAIELSNNSNILDFDDFAHSRDHCLEVQLPFIQFIKSRDFDIVPIIMIMQDIDTAYSLGNTLKETIDEHEKESTMLIGSSDLTHYEPNITAHRKDSELIKSILTLDVAKFYATLERLDVSACGYGAIATIMVAVRALGATKGELLKYATSGDVTGDTGAVVGYSSIVFV